MQQYFFDSSALAKVYHPELGTGEVLRILSEQDRTIIISRLTLVEIQSVFAVKVRTGEISREDAEMLRQRLVAQVASGDYDIFTVTDSHFASAEQFIIKYGFEYRLRTLDALHLAIAADLQSRLVGGICGSLIRSNGGRKLSSRSRRIRWRIAQL